MCWVGIKIVEAIAAQSCLIYWNIEGVCSPAYSESLDASLLERLLGAIREGC